jgi:endonuclease/exonuclease/phosphatase family metal-dependent hydrolase
MKVLTWNIQGMFRAASAPDPLAALATLRSRPDIMTLQEVTPTQAEAICAGLQEVGYNTAYSYHHDMARLKFGCIIAARTSMSSCNLASYHFPFPQLAAHAQVSTVDGAINVVTVHIPNGDNHGWKKVEAFEALKRLVLRLKGQPLVLTGDFNEPYWAPLHDGQIVTWGQDHWDGAHWVAKGTWEDPNNVSDKWERWDAAVRWFFECQQESGLRIAFWDKASHGSMEASHGSWRDPRWIDHILVSGAFGVKTCKYLHAWRKDGFSDHSPLVAVLTYRPG